MPLTRFRASGPPVSCRRIATVVGRVGAVLLLVGAAPAGTLHAQGTATVRGQVVQADSVTRAGGVVVALADSVGREVARTLTDADGSFSVRVTAPARYSLRALKIGLRPTSVAPFDIAEAEVRSVQVVLSAESVRLDAVRVEGATSCQISRDSAQTVARLWEQAKGVLAASTMAAGGRIYETTLLRYRNYVPFDLRRVIDEAASIVEAAGASGFVALHEDSLANEGYIVTAGSRMEFRAPDAAVLLSESFAATHCFRVVPPPRTRPDWVGIAFRPSGTRSGISDITGTFWLDRESSELRRLEFTYVNLPPRMRRDDASGWVQFARLPTGDWIVSRWAIRTPVNDYASQTMQNMPAKVIGTTTAGGITRSVMLDDAPVFTDVAAAVTVRLSESDTLNGAVGSVVTILGTERTGYTDSLRTVTFESLPEGKYRFQVLTPLMLWINADPVTRDVEVSGEAEHDVEIRMPTAMSTNTCGRGFAFVYGVITNADGTPARFARVLVDHVSGKTARTGYLKTDDRADVSRVLYADQYGRWKTCERPGPVAFSLAIGGAVGPRHSMLFTAGGAFTRLDLSATELIRP